MGNGGVALHDGEDLDAARRGILSPRVRRRPGVPNVEIDCGSSRRRGDPLKRSSRGDRGRRGRRRSRVDRCGSAATSRFSNCCRGWCRSRRGVSANREVVPQTGITAHTGFLVARAKASADDASRSYARGRSGRKCADSYRWRRCEAIVDRLDADKIGLAMEKATPRRCAFSNNVRVAGVQRRDYARKAGHHSSHGRRPKVSTR